MEGFAASQVCDLLDVSRSGFYAWRKTEESLREESDRGLVPIIREIFWHHQRRYGARRIVAELNERGVSCGVARAARLMKTQGFQAIQPKSFKPRTTESRHRLGYNQNLLAGRSPATKINEIWVGDITYIPVEPGRSTNRIGYLALQMDLCSRRIVGWDYHTMMDETLVLGALHRAIRERQPDSGLIHHTDRGGQYASKRYREILRRSEMRQSMSGADNCYDNAFMESCFGTLKTELELAAYSSHSEAIRELSSYIRYYNADRRHSSLGYATPIEFEAQQTVQK
jgi:putative transposase